MPLSTINSNSIGNGTVIAADILDGTISSSKLVSANIAGDRIAANTLSNTVFQTGSVENYLNAQSGGALSGRNRVINGAMIIDQRNAGAAITPTNAQYSVDRWQGVLTASAKFTMQQDSSANTVSGFSNSLKITSLSSYSVTSGDIHNICHSIEGTNLADLDWGSTAASAGKTAKPITISFWVRSSLTGTFGLTLNNNGASRTYVASYTIVSANTWEYKTITVPGDTGGTWLMGNNTGTGLQLRWGIGVGTTYSGSVTGSWSSSEFYGTTGATSVIGTNGATWYITGVQVEKGSIATPFEYRQYGNEFQLCQRYYYRLNGNQNNGGNANDGGLFLITAYNSTSYYGAFVYPVVPRSYPTWSYSNLSNTVLVGAGSSAVPNSFQVQSGINRTEYYFTTSSGWLTAGQSGWVRINQTDWFAYSAEL